DEPGSHNRENKSDTRDYHRQDNRGKSAELVGRSVDLLSQHHGCQDGSHIGAEKVSAHTGHVAYVITDVVGNRGGVADIVFRDTGLDLSYEVGADVSGFGID